MSQPADILAQVQQGQVDPSWRVYPAKNTFFIRRTLAGLLLIVLALAVWIYLYRADTVIVPRFSPNALTDSEFATWRIIDTVVLSLLILGALLALVKSVLDLRSLRSHLLVILPQGFIKQEGKQMDAFTYNEIVGLKTRSAAGETHLLIQQRSQPKPVTVAIDARFGPSKQVAQQITEGYAHYSNGAFSKR